MILEELNKKYKNNKHWNITKQEIGMGGFYNPNYVKELISIVSELEMDKISNEELVRKYYKSILDLLKDPDETNLIRYTRELLSRLNRGQRAILAMEKIFYGLRERHIKGECVNCDYTLKLCKEYGEKP